MNITLRQLRIFQAVARTGGFGRAGEQIGLTQPAVSRAIRELESALDAQLIARSTRELQLTEAGERLAASLDRVLDDLDGALQSARELGSARAGKVRIASSPTLSANLMPDCISACRRRYPDITLALRDQVQALVLSSVRSGEVDFGVVIEPQSADDLIHEPIMVDPFCVVFRNDHPLARRRRVNWRDLDGQSLVLLDYASGSRPVIDRALASQQVRYEVVQELGHSATVFRMVEAGIGVAVLPTLSLPLPRGAPLAARPLEPAVNRTIMLVRRRKHPLSAVAALVWDLVRERALAFSHHRQAIHE